jgi:tetratricopeptide (TPR) repeat protein
MKHSFNIIALVTFCLIVHSGKSVTGRTVNTSAEPTGISLAQTKLAAIVAQEERLFLSASSQTPVNEKELTRKIQNLVSDYESYLADNPKDQTALILYGKFLRRVDQPGPATGMFLKADKIDPDIAVIKQQIANYLAEEGRVAEALPYLLRAVELSPQTAVYHHQLGSFLFLFQEELIRLGITNRISNDRNMVIAFREASKLSPGNFDYRVRYAQSFFDVANTDWEEALVVWKELSNEYKRTREESEYLLLCQARVLLELGRQAEAKPLIDRVNSPVMGKTKRKLLDQFSAPLRKPNTKKLPSTLESAPKKDKNAQNKPRSHELLFDEDLQALSEISKQLEEEKLLHNLRVELIRAAYDSQGKVKISLKKLAEITRPEKAGLNF